MFIASPSPTILPLAELGIQAKVVNSLYVASDHVPVLLLYNI